MNCSGGIILVHIATPPKHAFVYLIFTAQFIPSWFSDSTFGMCYLGLESTTAEWPKNQKCPPGGKTWHKSGTKISKFPSFLFLSAIMLWPSFIFNSRSTYLGRGQKSTKTFRNTGKIQKMWPENGKCYFGVTESWKEKISRKPEKAYLGCVKPKTNPLFPAVNMALRIEI